jgi:hypothetical protein
MLMCALHGMRVLSGAVSVSMIWPAVLKTVLRPLSFLAILGNDTHQVAAAHQAIAEIAAARTRFLSMRNCNARAARCPILPISSADAAMASSCSIVVGLLSRSASSSARAAARTWQGTPHRQQATPGQ